MIKRLFAVLFFFAILQNAYAVDCDSCASCQANLTAGSNLYVTLANNINHSTSNCIAYGASKSNITFDCQGFIIAQSAVASDKYAITTSSSGHNLTIKNCNFVNWSATAGAVYLFSSGDVIFYNNSFFNTKNSLATFGTDNINISELRIYNTSGYYGIQITTIPRGLINGVVMENIKGNGFKIVRNLNDLVIENVTMNNITADNFVLPYTAGYSSSNVTLRNWTILNTTYSVSVRYGVSLSTITNSLFDKFYIESASAGGTLDQRPTGIYFASDVYNNTFSNFTMVNQKKRSLYASGFERSKAFK